MRQATLIYNPRAGTANFKAQLGDIQQFWLDHGWTVEIQPTQRPRHATTLARAAAARGDGLVLAAGGDGTLGEVASGLAHSDTVMAPLPLGTANAFAQELRLPRPNRMHPERLHDSMVALAAGRVQALDVGCNNDRYWLLWTGIGLDSHIVNGVEPRPPLAKRLGRLSYLLKAISLAPSWKGMTATVTVDDAVVRGHFFMVTATNCRLYAGGYLMMSPDAQMDDGEFDVWIFEGRRKLAALRYLLTIMRGRHFDYEGIRRLRGRRLFQIDSERAQPVHADGDPAGHTPISWEFHHRALRLVVPDTAPPDLFQEVGTPLRDLF